MPYNECACNYLLGIYSPILQRSDGIQPKFDKKSTERLLQVRELVEDIVNQDLGGAADAPAILSLLVELHTLTMQNRVANRQKYVL